MSTADPQTLIIERRLTSAQAERRGRVRDAARRLAEEGGYAAVTMDAVAERSGVARATIYRYFASKDHLLAEVAVAWGGEIAAQMRVDPPAGERLAARVAAALRRLMETLLANPRLTAAVANSVTSSDPEAARAQQLFTALVPGFLDIAIGDAAFERRAEVERVIEHVLFSALVNSTNGRLSGEEAIAMLESAAELLIGDAR